MPRPISKKRLLEMREKMNNQKSANAGTVLQLLDEVDRLKEYADNQESYWFREYMEQKNLREADSKRMTELLRGLCNGNEKPCVLCSSR